MNPGIHYDPKKETDRPKTKFEDNRRQAMNIKPSRYGFFRAGEPKEPLRCSTCSNIVQKGIWVNNVFRCEACFLNRNK